MKKPEEYRLKDLKKAVTIFKNGGVVIFPTDTVYGIGCRFDDQKATERIYQIKKTPKNQTLTFTKIDLIYLILLLKK